MSVVVSTNTMKSSHFTFSGQIDQYSSPEYSTDCNIAIKWPVDCVWHIYQNKLLGRDMPILIALNVHYTWM